ncbi:MAG: HDIG domain-containing metalloprotein [Candidatus Bathyarchaeia archaeon]
MSRRLPTRKEAIGFLVKAGCSPGVVRHAKSVAALAVEIAKACQKKGLKVNLRLVEIGALLHDIGRSKTHSVNHVLAGVEIAKSLGLPDGVVSIVERHAGSGIPKDEAQKLGWPVKDYVPLTLEEKIVTYADKLIEGLKRISVRQVLEKFSRDGLPQSSIVRMKRLHKEFSPILGDLDANDNAS